MGVAASINRKQVSAMCSIFFVISLTKVVQTEDNTKLFYIFMVKVYFCLIFAVEKDNM
jgi:hypothetical protein